MTLSQNISAPDVRNNIHRDFTVFFRGANIDKSDKDSFSPLILAASEGHAEAIKVLLARGADPYHVDKNDKTCIFWAAEEDNLEALKVCCCHYLS